MWSWALWTHQASGFNGTDGVLRVCLGLNEGRDVAGVSCGVCMPSLILLLLAGDSESRETCISTGRGTRAGAGLGASWYFLMQAGHQHEPGRAGAGVEQPS